MIKAVIAQIEASIAVKKAVLNDATLIGQIEALAVRCVASLKSGGEIFFANTGESLANAQHLSAKCISCFMFDRAPLSSLVLGANNSAISAIGNGYEQVFTRELFVVAKVDDFFIPILTSGNILIAAEQAKQNGLAIVAFTGLDGGRLTNMCDCLCIPSSETGRM
jgi:D-sedoheptulose 7-phosphate isomerase